MSAAANRGKTAEKKVKDALAELERTRMHFTYNRVQDAHSAGGRFTPQAGDYQAFSLDGERSRNFILEVKELKHDYRLPHGSYSIDKVARVRKRQLAGTECLVLLYHSEAKRWRAVEFDVFLQREGGSWDLRDWPHVDMPTALQNFLGLT
jgi:hypothetical protein